MLLSAGTTLAEAPKVSHTRAWVLFAPADAPGRIDPSGLIRTGDELVLVSDKAHLPGLYRLSFGAGHQARMHPWRTPYAADAGHDTEGLAICGNTIWMVVEGANQLVELPSEGPARTVRLNFDGVGTRIPPAVTWMNAGLEGVACAPDGRTWVAKEREPRAIYTIDASTGRATGVWETWAAGDVERQVDGVTISPSWSDLQYLDGHLYALHRDARAVVRLDPDTGARTGLMRLELEEDLLYADAAPYGMAEGLWIEHGVVWILLDNNDRTMRAGPRAGEPAPLLFEFPRPSGF